MAKNILYPGHSVNLDLTVAVGVVSGAPVEIEALHGVALEDRGSDGKAVVKLPIAFVADLAVEAVDGTGDSAIAIGEKLYYDAAATIKVNKDSTNGKPIGYALEAVNAGASDTIMVGIAAL